MDLHLEWRGLFFGLLTAAALASITSLTERVLKVLLPRPRDFDRTRRHVDSRDAFVKLVVSCEGIPALINGSFVHRSAHGHVEPPPLRRRFAVLSLFLISIIVTISSETCFIMAGGSNTSILKVPDVTPFSFLMRHLVVNGSALPSIPKTTMNNIGCVENVEPIYTERKYSNYGQRVCLVPLHFVKNKNMTMKEWNFGIEASYVDRTRFYVGVLVAQEAPPGFVRNAYGRLTVYVQRRVYYDLKDIGRVLNEDTGRLITRAVDAKLPTCSVVEILEQPKTAAGQNLSPMQLANVSCDPPITYTQAMAAMEAGAFANVGLYHYVSKPEPTFFNDFDREIIYREKELTVGMALSEPYEMGWFVALGVITLVGIVMFGLERCTNKYVYPNMALLSILNDVDEANGNTSSNGTMTQPLVAHAQAVSGGATKSVKRPLRYGFAPRFETHMYPLHSLDSLPTGKFTQNLRTPIPTSRTDKSDCDHSGTSEMLRGPSDASAYQQYRHSS